MQMANFSKFLVLLTAQISLGMFALPANGAVQQDIEALRRIVDIAIPAKAIKWEIIRTPESSDFLPPAPTDYVTLVAEVIPTNSKWRAQKELVFSDVWIAPDAARSWLSPRFRTLLTKPELISRESANCKSHTAIVRKSGRSVYGFACEDAGRVLIHLKLLGPSEDPNPELPPVFESKQE